MKNTFFALLLALFVQSTIYCEILSREGSGYLELIEGQKVLHVKGSAYDMGFQHGKLLKNEIHEVVKKYILQTKPENEKKSGAFQAHIPELLKYAPESLKQEMQGMADGAEISLSKIIALNLFPEMFHCSGLTVTNELTANHLLYHVRALDYNIGRGLENYATLIVAEPEGKIPFLNVSYAGFIGVITGMNHEKISFGEIGGAGYGFWNGMPMSFLIREVLENAHNLEEAEWILRDNPRTCEYYYVVADGKTNQSMGVYATESQIHFIEPGSRYALLAPSPLPKNYQSRGENDKFFLNDYKLQVSPYQTLVTEGENTIAMFNKQPDNSVILTGYKADKRYRSLAELVEKNSGKINERVLSEIIQVEGKDSNLHNAIFLPSELKVWISHRTETTPAYNNPYSSFDFEELLRK